MKTTGSATEDRPQGDSLGLEMSILVASRDAGEIQTIRYLLKGSPRFRLSVARSLADSHKALREKELDAVLTDMSLPDGDAFALLDLLRTRIPAPVAVVVLLEPKQAGLSRRLLEEGVQDILVKRAFDGPTLERVLVFAIRREAFRRTHAENHRQLIEMALDDPLTECLSRAGLQRVLQESLAGGVGQASPMSALLVDCRDLKSINTRYGLSTGDKVLVKVASVLKGIAGDRATWAKLGRDFLGLLPGVPLERAREITRAIRKAIGRIELFVGEKTVGVRVLAGYTEVTPETHTIEDLVGDIYRRSRSRSSTRSANKPAEPDGSASRRIASGPLAACLPTPPASDDLIEDLLRGVEGLRVVGQDIVELASGRPVACELLVRGTEHLERPEELFALAENLDRVTILDRECLKTCLRSADQLPEDQRVHFNLHPRTLLETPAGEIAELLEELVGERDVVIELDIQNLLGTSPKIASQLEVLQGCGFLVGVDHLLVDPSLLKIVMHLRPQIIKSSPFLFRDLRHPSRQARELERLIALSKSVGAEFVAVGVETEEERSAALDLGVVFGQGRLFGEPRSLELPPMDAEFERLLPPSFVRTPMEAETAPAAPPSGPKGTT